MSRGKMTNTPQIDIRLKQQEIQWFLDFINIKNISDLSKIERAEIAGVIQKYIHHQRLEDNQGYEAVSSELMMHLESMISPDRLIVFQERILGFFGYLKGRISYVVNNIDREWTRTEESDFYPTLNLETIGINYRLQVEGLRYEKKVANARPIAHKLVPESISDAIIAVHQDSSVEVEYFLLSFIKIISGVRITAFKSCPECKNWFVNLSKKSRQFCNNNCAARHGQKRKWAELIRKIENGDIEAKKKYDIECEKARKRSSDSYERKVKAKTPGAKVEKRPRKSYPKN